jgi:hypothetical protein
MEMVMVYLERGEEKAMGGARRRDGARRRGKKKRWGKKKMAVRRDMRGERWEVAVRVTVHTLRGHWRLLNQRRLDPTDPPVEPHRKINV